MTAPMSWNSIRQRAVRRSTICSPADRAAVASRSGSRPSRSRVSGPRNHSMSSIADAGPMCWAKYVPSSIRTRAISCQFGLTGWRLLTSSKSASGNGRGCFGSTGTTSTPRCDNRRRARSMFGGHPSVTTILGGSCGTSAMISPPPVSMSKADATRARRDASSREYPHGGRSSVARPSSQSKLHPETSATAASSARSLNERTPTSCRYRQSDSSCGWHPHLGIERTSPWERILKLEESKGADVCAQFTRGFHRRAGGDGGGGARG